MKYVLALALMAATVLPFFATESDAACRAVRRTVYCTPPR